MAISHAKWRSERVTARRSIYGMGAPRSDRTVALHKAEGRRYRLNHYSAKAR